MSKAFFHANHEAPGLTEKEFVEMIKRDPRPDIFATKLDFVKWCSDPQTDHCFYSFWEPCDSTSRLTKENGPAFLHGFCADFDVHHLDEAALARAIVDCPPAFPVAYISRTFSKGIRMVWLFEKPLPVFNREVAIGVAKRAIKELKLNKLAAGFDEEAFLDPAKYYELGTEWRPCSVERTIPSSYLTTWAFDASNKANFKTSGTSIPMEAIAAEAEKRWPGRWQGDFAVGAQGVRFWVPSSDSSKGAWIRETGIQDFVEGKFLHWDKIFDKEFVAKYEADRIGGAVDNVWYDGKGYWKRSSSDAWDAQNSEVFRRDLLCHKIDAERTRGAASEIDRAMNMVEQNQRVNGAFPFLYSQKDIHTMRGKRYLNVSRVHPTSPDPGIHFWGDGFPFTASILEGMFDPTQLQIFLSWFAYAYQGAIGHQARQGHALFVVGGVGSGKTLLGQQIIGPSLGGFSEGTGFISGKDMFNSELFESGIWCVDDAEIAADRQKHELYSQIIKKVVANPSMTYRRMYAEGVTLPWMGRLVVTMNVNAISMLPNIEAELLDKVIFLMAAKPNVRFGSNAENNVRIASELPCLLAHLRDWVIPEDLKDPLNNRFGMKAWHHPELIAEAKADAPSAEIAEIVELFRAEYFGQFPEKEFWEGSAQELMRELKMIDRDTIRETIRSPKQLGKGLTQLIAQGTFWLTKRRTSINQVYRMLNPKFTKTLTTIAEFIDSLGPDIPDEWGPEIGTEVVADGTELACQDS